MTRALLRKCQPLIVLALACALLLLGALTGTANAESWGEVSHVGIATGITPEKVNFTGTSTIAFAADSKDRSYYIGDEPKSGEYRIQRFVTVEKAGKLEAKVEGSISFSPPEAKKTHGGVGDNGVGLQLTVDPARNRVYALVVYLRRETAPAEEKALEEEEKKLEKEGKHCEEPKTCYTRFPLDSEELAAGELYAFEYTAGTLVSAKEKEGKPIPLINETTAESSTTSFADQSETPKEALLNPRGMAVDPKSGDVVIVGDQDEEPDEKVEKEEGEKQCRAAGQFVLLHENETTHKLASGTLGHRYVDRADALHPEQLGCGEGGPIEHTEVPLPLSPAITPGGNLLVYSGAEIEGQIWEFPTPGSSSGEGELETHPRNLFGQAQLGLVLDIEPPEIGAGPTMSFVPKEGASEGTIYVSTQAFGYYPAPLALHYAEAGGAGQISEIGWTAGSTEQQCGIPRFEEKVLLAGLTETRAGGGKGGGGVLVLAPWVQEGTGTPFLEAFEFGPGGSVTGCPKPSLSDLHVISGLNQNASEVPAGEPVTISSELEGAAAKSVEWKFKYTNSKTGESGEEVVTQESGAFQTQAGGYEFKPLEHSFKHAGSYEITEVAKTDDLAVEEAAQTLKLTVTPSPPIIKLTLPAPVRKGEGEAEVSATISDASETKLHLKTVTWNFGDGSAPVEEKVAPEEPNPATLHIKHTFISRCGKGKCTITLTVEPAEGKPAVAHVEITVNESKAEEEAGTPPTTTTPTTTTPTTTTPTTTPTTTTPTETTPKGGVAGYIASFPGSSLSVSSSGATPVTITCPSGGSCGGTLTLQTAGAVAASHGRHAKKKVLTLASGAFSLSGGTRSVTLHLSSTARGLLSSSHGVLKAKLTILSRGIDGQQNSVTTHVVTLRLVVKKHHKR